ncbi:hypothetical protein DFH09DRAFT_1495370 [Mycena vulgaris]|nr:hypothetical protein DFH09DRAFT_1495370 [Mycena vulgaris]
MLFTLELPRVYPTGLETRGCVEDPRVTRMGFRPDPNTGPGTGRPEGTRGCTHVHPYTVIINLDGPQAANMWSDVVAPRGDSADLKFGVTARIDHGRMFALGIEETKIRGMNFMKYAPEVNPVQVGSVSWSVYDPGSGDGWRVQRMSYYRDMDGTPMGSQSGISFKSNNAWQSYRRYSADPKPTDEAAQGDLACISRTTWKMYNGEAWGMVGEGQPHPKFGQARVGPECKWQSRRTVAAKAKRKRDGKEKEQGSTSGSQPPARHEPIPEVGVLKENAFLVPLRDRWSAPPLCYYTMVSEYSISVLNLLAHWASPLAQAPTFPLPDYHQAPHRSLVFEDLHTLGEDLINYHDLCAGDNTPMEPVSSVVDMLMKSSLSQPWQPGQKVIALGNVAATDAGILCCKLDWAAVVHRLGEGFAFGTQTWMYTDEELAKVFPPPPKATKGARQTEYLKKRGAEVWVTSLYTPPGWFTDMHIDSAGLAQAMVHVEGKKLWLLWPATRRNLDWWGLQHPAPLQGHGRRLGEALKALEGLEVLHITEQRAFILPPFCIHAVIAFECSTHVASSFAHSAHWNAARVGLDFCKQLVSNPEYPASTKMSLVERVISEAPIWEKAMGAMSEAAAYLAEWLADTKVIYEMLKHRDISSA